MVARLPRLGLIRLNGLLAAVALLIAACGGGSHRNAAPPTSPTPTQAAHRSALLSMFEAGGLMSDPSATLDQLRGLGVDAVRVFVPWGSLAPDPTVRHLPAGQNPASPVIYQGSAWAPYDALV